MSENMTTSSVLSDDVSECGCGAPETNQMAQGIVPISIETGGELSVINPIVTNSGTTGNTFPNVTINFNHYGPGVSHEEVPAAVVKVFEDKTVIKLPDEGIKVKVINENMTEKPGCYFDDEGNCPVCGY